MPAGILFSQALFHILRLHSEEDLMCTPVRQRKTSALRSPILFPGCRPLADRVSVWLGVSVFKNRRVFVDGGCKGGDHHKETAGRI